MTNEHKDRLTKTIDLNLYHDLISTASSMAQELQDIADDASEAGSPLIDMQSVIDDWENVYKKLETPWQELLGQESFTNDNEPTLLDDL